MASSAQCAHQLAPAQCDSLFDAVSRGNMTAARSVLDADPLGYLKRDQMKALLKACDVTAPTAVGVLDLFHARRHTLFRRSLDNHLDYALARATLYADKCLSECSAPELERDLLWATTSRNIPLALGVAIRTNDQPCVLRFMGLPAVQAFLASLEASFEPWFFRQAATHHYHLLYDWLALAMGLNMHAVVAMAVERCPLVTADAAMMHCTVIPHGVTKYDDLCARRGWLNRQTEAFHQAIQAGNVDVVVEMLEEVPALRRSRMDDDVTALMASSVAPNSIALLECLVDQSFTNEAVVEALVHACEHGAAAASIDHLWTWIESLDRDDRRRDCALWEAITTATSNQHLIALTVLLPHVRDWKTSEPRNILIKAIDTNNDAFACAVMELPVVEAYLKNLDDNGYGTIARIDVDSDEDACDCSHQGACSEVAFCHVPIAPTWVRRALRWGQRRVVDCLDKWWPTMTRKAAFLHCYKNPTTTNVAMEMNQRYVGDVTWLHTRDAHLVQHRVLPGLDHLGRHVATYLYGYDAHNEYNRIFNLRHSDESITLE